MNLQPSIDIRESSSCLISQAANKGNGHSLRTLTPWSCFNLVQLLNFPFQVRSRPKFCNSKLHMQEILLSYHDRVRGLSASKLNYHCAAQVPFLAGINWPSHPIYHDTRYQEGKALVAGVTPKSSRLHRPGLVYKVLPCAALHVSASCACLLVVIFVISQYFYSAQSFRAYFENVYSLLSPA